MKKQAVAIFAVIGTLLVLTASAQKPQVAPTQQLTVYDADNRKVGVVSGGNYTYGQFVPLVPFKVDNIPFLLEVFRDGIRLNGTVVYESTNCSGPPLVFSYNSSPSSLPQSAVGLPGTTIYVENGPPRTITVRSYSTAPVGWLDYKPQPPSSCVPTLPELFPGVAYPGRALIDLNTQFRPPFIVR